MRDESNLKLNIFDRFVNWYNSLEFSLGNVAASVMSILPPLIAAWMTFDNTQTYLSFGVYQAFVTAVVAEGLGYSSLSTAVMFYTSERERRRQKDTASPAMMGSALLAAFAFVFYLVVIITVNVLLERQFDEAGNLVNGIEVIARAALTSLTIPGGLIYALRAQNYGSRKTQLENYRLKMDAKAAEESLKLDLEIERKRALAKIRQENKDREHARRLEELRVQGSVRERSQQSEQSVHNRSGNGGKTQIEMAEEWLDSNAENWFSASDIPSAREIAKDLQDIYGFKFSTASTDKARKIFGKRVYGVDL